MSVNKAALASNDQIAGTTAGTVDTLYSATNKVATIDAFSAYNAHTSAVTLSVYILPSGVAATSVDPVAVQTITNGETAIITDILGHTVPKNGSIAAFAGTTAVVRCTASGTEIT